jgi:holo-[acyl-carrier protein] synthase
MHCTGVDIIEIARIGEAIAQRWGERFLNHVYTEAELKLYRNDIASLAVLFAGKEAVMKTLGWGMSDIGWREIEILPNVKGAPIVYLYGRAKRRAEQIKLDGVAISLSHCHQYAVASAVGEIENKKFA